MSYFTKEEAAVYEVYYKEFEFAVRLMYHLPLDPKPVVNEKAGVKVDKKHTIKTLLSLYAKKKIYAGLSIDQIITQHPFLIELLDDPSPELQRIAVEKASPAITRIKNPTKEVIRLAFVNQSNSYGKKEHIALFSDEELCDMLFENPKFVSSIPKGRFTDEMVRTYADSIYLRGDPVIENDWQLRNEIPEELKDRNYWRAMLSLSGYNYSFLPEEMQDIITPDLVQETLKSKTYSSPGWMIKYIPERLLTEELCLQCCKLYPPALQDIPKKYHTEEFYRNLNSDPNKKIPLEHWIDYMDLKQVSDEFLLEIYEESTWPNGGYGTLTKFPKNRMTPEIAKVLARYGASEHTVPKKYQTTEWIKDHAFYTGEFPKDTLLAEDIYLAAMHGNGYGCIKFMPKEAKTDSFWAKVLDERLYTRLELIPKNLLTKDIVDDCLYRGLVMEFTDIPSSLQSEELAHIFLQKNPLHYASVLQVYPKMEFINEVLSYPGHGRYIDMVIVHLLEKQNQAVPEELADRVIPLYPEAIFIENLTAWQINKSLEKFPQNILYADFSSVSGFENETDFTNNPFENELPATVSNSSDSIIDKLFQGEFQQMSLFDLVMA